MLLKEAIAILSEWEYVTPFQPEFQTITSSRFHSHSNVWIDRPLMLPVSSLPEKEFFLLKIIIIFILYF